MCIGLYEELSFKPISYPRLMEAERSRAGSEFQTTGTTTWKLRWSNWVLIQGTIISRRSP